MVCDLASAYVAFPSITSATYTTKSSTTRWPISTHVWQHTGASGKVLTRLELLHINVLELDIVKLLFHRQEVFDILRVKADVVEAQAYVVLFSQVSGCYPE